MIQQPKLGWTEHLRFSRLLGNGGQGVVYLSERGAAPNLHAARRAQNLLARAIQTMAITAMRWSGWPRSAPALR